MGNVSFVSFRKPVRLIKRKEIEAWKMRSKLKKLRRESFEKHFALEAAAPAESSAPLKSGQEQ
jgi:hypothetical protein